jgi:hypothetical protein
MENNSKTIFEYRVFNMKIKPSPRGFPRVYLLKETDGTLEFTNLEEKINELSSSGGWELWQANLPNSYSDYNGELIASGFLFFRRPRPTPSKLRQEID